MIKVNLLRQSQAQQLLADLKALYSSSSAATKAAVKGALKQ